MKHTPGPWYPSGTSIFKNGDRKFPIAKVEFCRDETQGNVALITHAPELAKCLTEAVIRMGAVCPPEWKEALAKAGQLQPSLQKR
jgi:hypothetical protein